MNALVFAGLLIFFFSIGVSILRMYLRRATSYHPRRVFLPWLISISWGVTPVLVLSSEFVTSSALAVLLASINFFMFVLIGPMMIFRTVTARQSP